MRPKNVVLLGATGSIGTSTLKVAADLPDEIRIVGLAARENVDAMESACRESQPKAAAMSNPAKARELSKRLGKKIPVFEGEEGLIKLATMPEADIVLVAIVGTMGLKPALEAIRAGKDIAVASKEILVMAGSLVMSEAKKHGVRVLPVDSEHNAIFQCVEGKPNSDIKRLILTASGGPFRKTPRENFEKIAPADALKHPTWNMGNKITIDSATLFNKGLEMIEARWLFGVEMARVDVVIHPQSIVHSMVEFVDGSILAQLSVPDMRFPIQYALLYPRRLPNSMMKTDLASIGSLTFEAPDEEKFPALRLAREAGTVGGTLPAVLNAANEVAVENFSQNRVKFPQIWECVEAVMRRHRAVASPTLDDILQADSWSRQEAGRWIQQS
jgi:1-deoxy-D-xylulose-5-phosphate reductoisomerase